MKDKRRIRCQSHYQVPRLSTEAASYNHQQTNKNVENHQELSSDPSSNDKKIMNFDSTFCHDSDDKECPVMTFETFHENNLPIQHHHYKKQENQNRYLLESRNGPLVMDPPPNVPTSYV